MSRLEELLRDALNAHVDEAPSGAGLLPAVRARTARRRRITWTASTVAAAAAVALIAVAAVGLAGGGRSQTTSASAQPSVAAAPAGRQWVSYHGAQLLVPDSWKVNDATCGTPQHDTVMIEDGGTTLTCLATQPAGLTVVRMTTADSPLGKARAALATRPVTVDGQPARMGSGTPDRQRGPLQVLVLPSVNVVISVESPDQALARRILDSVRPAVPVDANGCRDQVDSLVPPTSGAAGHPQSLELRRPVAGSVCLYRNGWLTRSVRLDPTALSELVDTLRTLHFTNRPLDCGNGTPCPATPPVPPQTCDKTASGFLVQLADSDGTRTDVYVHIACQQPYVATGSYVAGLNQRLLLLLITATGYTGPVPDPNTLP